MRGDCYPRGLDFREDDRGSWMRKDDQGAVDLLEIFHARRIRDHILAQLKRLADAEAQGAVTDSALLRKASRYYEAMLVTVARFLEELGDRRPLD